jgi:hypothetical protein
MFLPPLSEEKGMKLNRHLLCVLSGMKMKDMEHRIAAMTPNAAGASIAISTAPAALVQAPSLQIAIQSTPQAPQPAAQLLTQPHSRPSPQDGMTTTKAQMQLANESFSF